MIVKNALKRSKFPGSLESLKLERCEGRGVGAFFGLLHPTKDYFNSLEHPQPNPAN